MIRAERYAKWLQANAASERSRAAILVWVLEQLAARDQRTGDQALRLYALADGEHCPSELQEPLLASSEQADLCAARGEAAHELGRAFDLLLAVESLGAGSGKSVLRRRLGSYFTPQAVARSLTARGFRTLQAAHAAPLQLAKSSPRLRVCDPAMGGGAFLIEAGAALARAGIEQGQSPEEALQNACACLWGFDVSELASATAEAALWLFGGECDEQGRLRTVDALDRNRVGPLAFDWVVGNPPWVSYQGRATQPISPGRRAELREGYEAFRGYPTLHGVFLQRAAELAPQGVISLLLPSSLSDLDGYRHARGCLRRTHRPDEPLLEYGEDAFPGVVQPCFGLVAIPHHGQLMGVDDSAPFRLEERAARSGVGAEVAPPEALLRLREGPRLPRECFAELGFQSNRVASERLFRRDICPAGPFDLPLLEGRVVGPFKVQAPRLFLNADPAALRSAGVGLRSAEAFSRVAFLVRQTAAFTIAARGQGMAFRNSLLAGYEQADLDADLLVGLLNSSTLRAYHLSARRDARQNTFPQVKVGHLRSLPLPPADERARIAVRKLSARATQEGLTAELCAELNQAVAHLYGFSSAEQQEVESFLRARAPRALPELAVP